MSDGYGRWCGKWVLTVLTVVVAWGIAGCFCPDTADPLGVNQPDPPAGELSLMRDRSASYTIVNCPDSMRDHAPSRIGTRHFENRFYKWAEYEFNRQGAVFVCFYLLEPESKPLSKDQALRLLNARQQDSFEPSQGDREREVLPADDPSLKRKGRVPPVHEDSTAPNSGTGAGPNQKE